MSSRNRQRSADALEALAAWFVAWTLYPSAQRLVDYLDETDDDTIRKDARAAAEALSQIRERIITFIDRSTPADDSNLVAELSEQLEGLQQAVSERDNVISDLRRELDERDTKTQQSDETHASERDRLIEEARAAKAQASEVTRTLEQVQEENHRLRAKSDSYAAALRERGPLPEELAVAEEDADTSLTIAGVIEIARDECDRVIVPGHALKEIDALEAHEKSANWAREILRGLQALQAYAVEAEHFTGGFWEWCEHSNHPDTWNASPQKLAMSESDTVKNDGRLWRKRRFLISTEVEPTGYRHMETHLKIAEGGGQHIPRLYFHDDVKGRTGNVHVGFIGPHRLVPNTHS